MFEVHGCLRAQTGRQWCVTEIVKPVVTRSAICLIRRWPLCWNLPVHNSYYKQNHDSEV